MRLEDKVAYWFIQTAIELARFVADIRYDDIVVDPRLQTVSLLNLRVDTGQFAFAVDQFTVNTGSFSLLAAEANSTLGLRGLVMPLDQLDLPAEIAPYLSPRGDDVLLGDLELQVGYHMPSSRVQLLATTLLADLGRVDLEVEMSGLRPNLEEEGEQLGYFERAALRIRDAGGVEHTLEQLAAAQNVPVAQLRQSLIHAAGEQVLSFVDSPAEAASILTAVTRFLEGEEGLDVLLAPPEPLPLGAIPALFGAGAVDILGLDVLSGEPTHAIPPLPPVEATSPSEVVVAAATAYAEGVGVPQNFARALELAARAAEAGDPRGMLLQARLLADGDGGTDERREAYRMAALAAAAGEAEGAALATRLETTMPAELVAAVQTEAIEAWRAAGPGKAFLATEQAARGGETTAMRDLAQAFLTGDGAPRSYAEGYLWASVAAARGDGLAASMRDRVVGAVRQGVVPRQVLQDAQSRAARLWDELAQR